MKKQEFISELKRELGGAPSHIREEIMADISEHFTEAVSQGMSEEDVCRNLGQPKDIARQVMEEYGETPRKGDHAGDNISDLAQHIAERVDFAQRLAQRAKESLGYDDGEHGGGDVYIDESFERIHGIKIRMLDAKVRFAPSDDGRTRVTARGQVRDGSVSVGNQGGELIITSESKPPRFRVFGISRFSSNLVVTVYVPAQFDGKIKVNNSMGNIHADGISGRLSFKASAGNVSIDDCSCKEVKVSASAGNVGVHLTSGRVDELKISAAAGNVKLTADETGELKISSAAGNIEASVTRLYGDTSASSAAGSLKLTSHDVRGNITVSTAAGSAKVYLPKDVNCRIEAKKPGIGSLSNQLTGNPDSPYVLRATTAVGSIKLIAL